MDVVRVKRSDRLIGSSELVECIGACANAPALLLNEDLVTNLTPASIDAMIADCRQKAGAPAATA